MKYTSNLAWSWPASSSPHLLNHPMVGYLYSEVDFGLHVCTTMDSKCTSNLAQSQCQNQTIMAFQWITIITLSWLPCSHDRGLQVASPTSLNHCLQVHLKVHLIRASKFTPSWSPSSSPNSLDYGLLHHATMASKSVSNITESWLPSMHNLGLQLLSQTSFSHTLIQSIYSMDHKFGMRSPFRHIHNNPTCKYLAMQVQLCGGGQKEVSTYISMLWKHCGEYSRHYKNSVPIKRAVFSRRVVTRVPSQNLENVTGLPQSTTLPIIPQNIIQT